MQKVYLLLRNNKQSGPYSLEELAQQRLKPLDLIWIEGRSAAWQYASEVGALKPYLPEGQESTQPRDNVASKESHSSYMPPESQEIAAKKTPSPKVYVSLPNGGSAKTVAHATPTARPQQTSVAPPDPSPAVKPQPRPAPVTEPVASVPVTKPPLFPDVTEKEKLVTKYSSTLEEKEEAYTQWIYQKKTKKQTLAPEWIGGIAVVVLLLMGSAVYFFSNRGDDGSGVKQLTATDVRPVEVLETTVPPAEAPANPPAEAAATPPAEPLANGPAGHVVNSPAHSATPQVVAANEAKHEHANKTSYVVNQPRAEAPAPAVQTTKKKELPVKAPPVVVAPTQRPNQVVVLPRNTPSSTAKNPPVLEPVKKPLEKTTPVETAEAKKKKSFTEKVDGFFDRIVHAKQVEQTPRPVATEPQTAPVGEGERKAVHRNDEPNTVKENPAKDLTAGMEVTTIESANNWMQGVHGLKMKVDNRNDVKVANAAVEVRYLNEQNALLEKKMIHINDIPAGRSVTMSIPDHRLADHAEASLVSAGN